MADNPLRRDFIKAFNGIGREHHRYKVFNDFIVMASIAIENTFLKSETLEQQYLGIVQQYKKDDVSLFPQLLALLTEGLDPMNDFLGSIFMELGLGDTHGGQFFTPYEVCRLMAKINLGEPQRLITGQRPYITVSEPTCGAGAMVIAIAEAMLEGGINPQQALWVSCVDVSETAARMCHLQLSLLGIPGEVVIGNSLSLDVSRTMRTPMHHIGAWDLRLRSERLEAGAVPAGASETRETLPVGQISLFDVQL